MTGWKTAICRINGIDIHYTRTRGDKPVLVLLHGLAADGLCWTELARFLEKDYDIIMPDARGHGKSGFPGYGYSYEDHANDVTGLINSLGIIAPVLVGHSMGGMTAAVVADRIPKLVQGIILADPPFLSVKVQRQICDSEVVDQFRRIPGKPLEELMADLRSRHPDRSLNTIQLIARAQLQTSLAAFDVLTGPYPDYKQLVSKIDIPALLLYGDKGVVSPRLAKKLHHLNPRLQVLQIHGAGHGLHYDQPESVAEAIRSFLCSIGKRVEPLYVKRRSML